MTWGAGRKLPSNWKAIREAVFRRCRGRCEYVVAGRRCAARATEVDHIDDPNDHSLANLQGLCADHHHRKTQAQAAAGKRRANVYRRRKPKPEPHPGDRRDRR
jgi:5-methylcytosine-specific restriction endonuclease McrA